MWEEKLAEQWHKEAKLLCQHQDYTPDSRTNTASTQPKAIAMPNKQDREVFFCFIFFTPNPSAVKMVLTLILAILD